MSKHLLDSIEEILSERGPMHSDEIARTLGATGAAVAVISPESIEKQERDGENVLIVKGGAHRALSPIAIDARLSKSMSGFRRRSDGKWEVLGDYADEVVKEVQRC